MVLTELVQLWWPERNGKKKSEDVHHEVNIRIKSPCLRGVRMSITRVKEIRSEDLSTKKKKVLNNLSLIQEAQRSPKGDTHTQSHWDQNMNRQNKKRNLENSKRKDSPTRGMATRLPRKEESEGLVCCSQNAENVGTVTCELGNQKITVGKHL